MQEGSRIILNYYKNLRELCYHLLLPSGRLGGGRLFKEDAMVYALRQFLLIMSNHDECLVLALAESLNHILHETTVLHIKSMKWLVKNKE